MGVYPNYPKTKYQQFFQNLILVFESTGVSNFMHLEIEKIALIIGWLISFSGGIWYLSAKHTELQINVKKNQEDIDRLRSSVRSECRGDKQLVWLTLKHIERYLAKTTDYNELILKKDKTNNDEF
ncbi:hypothetical protein HFV01_02855 [Limnospira fusiformis SAG 85.79]|nr:hypothetical protein SPLC1_S230490 [Arthrospira platensis C1]EKD09211.1 hypothetical protein SPLC1_S206120 [Arthrospira platensis C1]QJB24621.1 hypothetical protein HFV01_00980 [Limnospira fusiformis SAG 85.79]QJB24938.1 hypothetical protein HFV01_02855 [Limnospira fusiformis SAG 85.79]